MALLSLLTLSLSSARRSAFSKFSRVKIRSYSGAKPDYFYSFQNRIKFGIQFKIQLLFVFFQIRKREKKVQNYFDEFNEERIWKVRDKCNTHGRVVL